MCNKNNTLYFEGIFCPRAMYDPKKTKHYSNTGPKIGALNRTLAPPMWSF